MVVNITSRRSRIIKASLMCKDQHCKAMRNKNIQPFAFGCFNLGVEVAANFWLNVCTTLYNLLSVLQNVKSTRHRTYGCPKHAPPSYRNARCASLRGRPNRPTESGCNRHDMGTCVRACNKHMLGFMQKLSIDKCKRRSSECTYSHMNVYIHTNAGYTGNSQ